MHLAQMVRKYLGWCPNIHAGMQDITIPTDGAVIAPLGSGRLDQGKMNIDPIVKNELARSIGVFFFSLVFFSILFATGIVEMPGYFPFLLAFAATGIIFWVLVWFRKNHAPVKITANFSHKAKLGGALSIFILYFLYLSISVLYPVTGIVWPAVLLLMVIILVNISFKNGRYYQVNLPRWLFFYIFVAALFIFRDLVLGYPFTQDITFIAILGIISVVVVFAYNKVSGDNREKSTG